MRHLARFFQADVFLQKLLTDLCLSDFLLACPLLVCPHRFDIRDDAHDIGFRELISKGWHGIEICGVHEANTTFKNVTNEQSIPMMPGMSGFVVGRRAQPPGCVRLERSIWKLPFAIHTVTGGAVLNVELLSKSELLVIESLTSYPYFRFTGTGSQQRHSYNC